MRFPGAIVATPKFVATVHAVFTTIDVHIIQTPVRAPRANTIAERFAGSIRREFLDRILIINQRHPTAVLREHEHHHNSHRPHRPLGQTAPLRPLPHNTTTRSATSADATDWVDSSTNISRSREVCSISGTHTVPVSAL